MEVKTFEEVVENQLNVAHNIINFNWTAILFPQFKEELLRMLEVLDADSIELVYGMGTQYLEISKEGCKSNDTEDIIQISMYRKDKDYFSTEIKLEDNEYITLQEQEEEGYYAYEIKLSEIAADIYLNVVSESWGDQKYPYLELDGFVLTRVTPVEFEKTFVVSRVGGSQTRVANTIEEACRLMNIENPIINKSNQTILVKGVNVGHDSTYTYKIQK
jgi:hypothetical protein